MTELEGVLFLISHKESELKTLYKRKEILEKQKKSDKKKGKKMNDIIRSNSIADGILKDIAEKYGVDEQMLRIGSRDRESQDAKQEFVHKMKELGYTHKRIGKYIGCTHGAITYIIKKIKKVQ